MNGLIAAGLYLCIGSITQEFRSKTYGGPQDLSGTGRNIEDDVQFLVYTSKNRHEPYFLRLYDDDAIGNFNFNDPTVMFIHGFTERAQSKSAQTIKEAFLDQGKYNVILVNWKNLAIGPNYCDAVQMLPVVAKYSSRLLMWLNTNNPTFLSNFHLIGFSLGAHISALIGHYISEFAGQKIDRITGLDPAGPTFDEKSDKDKRLDKSDATFVDIIHTNTKRYGIELPLGHVDFYVNGGKSQPACHFEKACSHKRAWRYFAESVLNPYGFLGAKCTNHHLDYCFTKKNNFMGFGVERENTGIFSINTNSQPPFAKGENGIP